MIFIRCDKCKAEVNECSQVKFLTKREKVFCNDSLSYYSDEEITGEIQLCPTYVKKLFNEWVVTK